MNIARLDRHNSLLSFPLRSASSFSWPLSWAKEIPHLSAHGQVTSVLHGVLSGIYATKTCDLLSEDLLSEPLTVPATFIRAMSASEFCSPMYWGPRGTPLHIHLAGMVVSGLEVMVSLVIACTSFIYLTLVPSSASGTRALAPLPIMPWENTVPLWFFIYSKARKTLEKQLSLYRSLSA